MVKNAPTLVSAFFGAVFIVFGTLEYYSGRDAMLIAGSILFAAAVVSEAIRKRN